MTHEEILTTLGHYVDYLIDLVFMMDMEAGHLIPGVTVHAVNKKVNVGRVDIFRNHNAAPHCRGAGHPAIGYCCLF